MERVYQKLLCLLAVLALAVLPARADAGDYDQIDSYNITVELRSDGSADITYEVDWQVIGGGADEYLSWVRVGLANRHVDMLENLTPSTIENINIDRDGGTWARINFRQKYYAPDVAAERGAESSVHFSFRVHQSHLFTLNDDGTASFVFTPGWFDDLNVQQMTVRWKNGEDFLADNTGEADGYLTWQFGPLAHGQAGTVRVTVPVTAAAVYDPEDQLQASDSDGYEDDVLAMLVLVILVVVVVWVLVAVRLRRRRAPWYGGFGGLERSDWVWYTNGTRTVRYARGHQPPAGYRPTAPPASFKAGGGSFRGGGVGRGSGGGCASSCACACASSCACACACAGGGRAGCSAKNFTRITLPDEKE